MRRVLGISLFVLTISGCGVTLDQSESALARRDALGECKTCDPDLVCTKTKTGECNCECLDSNGVCYGCPDDPME